ncbi:unnamed protein product [Blepharisma stoltei]|uniref:Uncharacterized protein n=1 Tax=Blepharisma stoltei TaxID=1481888 RepID=A0AAU9JN88_9CILI|nr:unnamed protein product [Blepharisma stoltei]
MNPTPHPKIQKIRDYQEKNRIILIGLVTVTIILVTDLLYLAPKKGSMFGTNFMAPLTLACVVMTGAMTIKYINSDLEANKAINSINYAQIHYENKEIIENQEQVIISHSQVVEEWMKKKGIDMKIRQWIMNVRQWYSKELIPYILNSNVENIMQLNKLLKEFTKKCEKHWIYEGSFDDIKGFELTHDEKTVYKRVSIRDIQDLIKDLKFNYTLDLELSKKESAIPGDSSKEEALKRLQLADIVRQRLLLDNFFEIPTFNCRNFVISRLYTLSSTLSLKDYQASPAVSDNSWTSRKPSDPQILSHLFFRLLNNLNNPTVDPNFNMFSEIVTEAPPSSMHISKVLFYQTSRIPTFEILSGSEIWTPHKDSDNLFSAIALFLYHVQQKNNGYFYSMDCRDFFKLIY